MVRSLDERHARAAHEPTQRHLEKRSCRHVVAIEHGDEVAVGVRHCVIEVSRLGMPVIRPDDVPGAAFLGEITKCTAATVIENVDTQLFRRPIHGKGSQHRRAHDRQVFVVGWHVHIDAWPIGRIGWQRRGLALQRPDGLDIAQCQHNDRIELGQGEAYAK